MMNSIFVSVIVPTYNRATMLAQAINSVLNQPFPDFELVIVDDGSTDDTEMAVTTWNDPRIRYKKIANSERGAARNVGVHLSRGKYVTFLDSDDYFCKDHLQFVYLRLAELQFPAVFHQAYVIKNGAGKILQKPYKDNDLGKALFTNGNIMSCMGVFVRRDVMLPNLFNEDRSLAGLEDWELWIRLAAQYPIHYDRKVTGVLLQHDQRSTVSVDRLRLEEKCELFIHLVSINPVAMEKYGRYIRCLSANVYTYLSLHLSLSKSKKKAAWWYLCKGINRHKSQLMKKRTLVILRNLIFS